MVSGRVDVAVYVGREVIGDDVRWMEDAGGRYREVGGILVCQAKLGRERDGRESRERES